MCDNSQTISSETPTATQGLNSARMYGMGDGEISSPTLCIPRLKKELPSTLDTTTTAVTTRVLSCRRFRGEVMVKWRMAARMPVLVSSACRGGGFPLLADITFAFRSQRQVFTSLFGEPLALRRVEHGFAHHAPDHARPEIILVIEPLDGVHQFALAQGGIADVGQLVPAFVGHAFNRDQRVLLSVFVKFRARKSMPQ